MSCGQGWDGNAVGMGVYEEFVQVGVAKMSWGTRSPYSTSADYDGDVLFTVVGANLDPASYHIYTVTYQGTDPDGHYAFAPTAYYDNGHHTFTGPYFSERPHSSFTGIESDTVGCLTGYSQFQNNLYQPSPGNPYQPWCYDAYGLPTFATQSLPLGPCVDGYGKQWWIGN